MTTLTLPVPNSPSTNHHAVNCLVSLALRIWAIRWEKAIGCQLLGKDSGLSLEFNMKSLLRGDPKTQAETNEIRLKNGVINQDQWHLRIQHIGDSE